MPSKKFKYTLDPSSKKFTCPSCGQKRFVRYINNETKQYLEDELGRCDRENECQYHLKPSGEVNEFVQIPEVKIETAFPNGNTESQFDKTDSNFHEFCYSIGITEDHMRKMAVGKSDLYTTFGLKNIEGKTLNVKYIQYGVEGNRDREKFPFYMKAPEGKKYLRCLYGLHTLDKDLETVIVESEKSAVISKYFYPNYNWLATGGNNAAKYEHLEALYGHKKNIFYLSDNDKAGKQNKTIEHLNKINEVSGRIFVLDPFKDFSDGFDIADWILANTDKITGDLLKDLGIDPSNKIEEILKERSLSWENPIPKPPSILSIKDGTISTPGNITVITGHSKSGKSGFVGAIVSGSMTNQNIDTLGIDVKYNDEGKALIIIDTEQSRYNFDRNYRNNIRRSGLSSPPEWVFPVWLSGLSPKEVLEYTKGIAGYLSDKFGGIHSMLIDGIGDYVNSVNDEEESNKIVEEFRAMSELYDCPVITVLHFNPGTSKERGHIGSQLQRKAESVIEISKDENEVSTVSYKLLRNAGNIPEIKFSYDKDLGYHTMLGFDEGKGVADEYQEQKNEEMRIKMHEVALSFFIDHDTLTTGELVKMINEEFLLTGRSRANDYIRWMIHTEAIDKVARGVYKLGRAVNQ